MKSEPMRLFPFFSTININNHSFTTFSSCCFGLQCLFFFFSSLVVLLISLPSLKFHHRCRHGRNWVKVSVFIYRHLLSILITFRWDPLPGISSRFARLNTPSVGCVKLAGVLRIGCHGRVDVHCYDEITQFLSICTSSDVEWSIFT